MARPCGTRRARRVGRGLRRRRWRKGEGPGACGGEPPSQPPRSAAELLLFLHALAYAQCVPLLGGALAALQVRALKAVVDVRLGRRAAGT